MTRKKSRNAVMVEMPRSVVFDISLELADMLAMAQKAKSFEVILDMNKSLVRVTSEIQELQKTTGKNQSMVLSQLIGQKNILERHIELIMATETQRMSR